MIKNTFQTATAAAVELDQQLQKKVAGVPIAQLYIAEIGHAIQNKKLRGKSQHWEQALKLFINGSGEVQIGN